MDKKGEEEKRYTAKDYKILQNFIKQSKESKGSGITPIKGITLKKIASQTDLSEIKVRKTINSFLTDGFVKEGVKKVRANSYYITKEGHDELKRLSKNDLGGF